MANFPRKSFDVHHHPSKVETHGVDCFAPRFSGGKQSPLCKRCMADVALLHRPSARGAHWRLDDLPGLEIRTAHPVLQSARNEDVLENRKWNGWLQPASTCGSEPRRPDSSSADILPRSKCVAICCQFGPICICSLLKRPKLMMNWTPMWCKQPWQDGSSRTPDRYVF